MESGDEERGSENAEEVELMDCENYNVILHIKDVIEACDARWQTQMYADVYFKLLGE